MTAAADLVVTGAEVHPVAAPEQTAEAVAVRDGRIARVGSAYEVGFLEGVETRTVDLEGATVLPGFVDAHTHLPMAGRYRRHADLRGAAGPAECVERLRAEAGESEGWVLGFGFEESAWAEARYLRRGDLDRVSEERPVAAVREDAHLVAVNTAALERLDLPGDGVETEDGRPTGVLTEAAATRVFDAIEPDAAGTRALLRAGRERALERGVTAVHDVVSRSAVARGYRDLAHAGDLDLWVRLNYRREFGDALTEAGLGPDHGGQVETGALKAFADGSIGARTAKLSAPYADGEGTGEWVTEPGALRAAVAAAEDAGFQAAVHAIGDAAVEATVEAFEGADAGERRHRIEHAELLPEGAIERLAATGAVASVQPNFLKWAGEGGLYERRLGDRRRLADRFGDLAAAGVPLAFGSDCMPLDPLLGVHHAVNAPEPAQRLSVTEALQAYTRGSAYAGFDEDVVGTIEAGKRGDLVALGRSPWDHPGEIRDTDVLLTVAGGEVVYDGRSANDP